MCKSKSSRGHLVHEKVMSQELYECWKTVTTGLYVLLRDSNKNNWESGRRIYNLLVLQYFIFQNLDLNETAIVKNL